MEHFGIIKHYSIKKIFSIDAFNSEKVSKDPLDHAVYGEIDVSEDFAFLFSVTNFTAGLLPDGEIVNEDSLFPETDDFRMKLEISEIRRHDARIGLKGMVFGGTSVEILHVDSGAMIDLYGLSYVDVPAEFYKETIAEAYCFELDQRLKQSLFTYTTALDSLLNFFLRDLYKFSELNHHTTHLTLLEKLTLTIKRALDTDQIGSLPLVSAITSLFTAHVHYRNTIAHSVKRVVVTPTMVEDAIYLLLTLQMVLEQKSVNIDELTAAYQLDRNHESEHFGCLGE